MPIHGTIEEAGLPDVLQLLSLGRKSGCLAVVNGDLHGEIYLDVGRIAYASTANRDRLGDLLVKNGRITLEQLNDATTKQARGSGRQLGRILLASGAVERADIEKYVRHQVEEAVYQLFAWKSGSFTFTSDAQPTHGALLVSLDPAALLLEGARRVDEWEQIERKIPSFDLVFQRTKARTSGEIADDLTEDQKRLLPLLDGTRDVNGLVDVTAMSEFDIGKALYGLIVAGIVRLVERRAAVRHLDYRELLAYVVREAELADPQRRKAAARHIVDCPDCSARLRTIHVRRTEGQPAMYDLPPQTPAEVTLDYLASISPAAEPMVVIAPKPFEPDDPMAEDSTIETVVAPVVRKSGGKAKKAWDGVDRRGGTPVPETPEQRQQREQERRAGRERRQRERRAYADRRDHHAPRPAISNERRLGPRRAVECGETHGDRRAFNRRGGSVAAAAAQARPNRKTETRRIATVTRPEPETVKADVEAVKPVPEMVKLPEPVTPPEPVKPPEQARPAAKTTPTPDELPWLTTPDESLTMIRQSRTQLPPKTPDPSVPRTTTSPPGAPVTPLMRPAARSAPPPPPSPPPPIRLERRAMAPAPTFDPYAEMPMAVGPPRPSPVIPPPVTPQGIFISTRQITIAATIAVVAALSYMAGSSRARAGLGAAAQTAAEAPAEPVVEAPPTRRPASTRANDTSPTTPLSAQNPPRNANSPLAVNSRGTLPAGVGVVRGSVRDQNGRPVPGANVAVRGTSLAAVADRSGNYEFRAVPEGSGAVQASAPGYNTAAAGFRLRAGATSMATVVLEPAAVAAAPAPAPAAAPPAAVPTPTPAPAPVTTQSTAPAAAPTITAAAPAEPDRELATGGWAAVDRAEAIAAMGGSIGAIQGLPIESITRSVTGSRPRIRVVQLTAAGERIVLTETRSGSATRTAGSGAVTAVRVMPPSEAYPFSTGTVSLGNLLVTAKTSISSDALRPLLERMAEIQ